MKWLQDNPLGMALAGISGFFVLLVVIMTVLWSLPVSVDTAANASGDSNSDEVILLAHTVKELSDFQVINEKPVFNESRLPVVDLMEGDGIDPDDTVAVKGAPDVKLTGVIITPSVRIASLTPANGNAKGLMAHEGQTLTGDYVGWQVSSVQPRSVVLESRDGQKLELNLQVHDVTIEQPPEPVAKVDPDPVVETQEEDGEPLSRAEQIRQRIAERREELRREQEQQQADDNQSNGRPSQNRPQANNKTTAPKQNYQSAIRALMNKNRKDTSSNDNKD